MKKQEITSTRIFIELEDRPLFVNLRDRIKKDLPRNTKFDTMMMFNLALLVGRNILHEKQKIIRSEGVVRENAPTSDNKIILHCTAISDTGDVELAYDEEDGVVGANTLRICEQYAKAGLHELDKWMNDKNIDFYERLTQELLKKDEENGITRQSMD